LQSSIFYKSNNNKKKSYWLFQGFFQKDSKLICFLAMDDELYDEFGNYIGPELDDALEEEEEEQNEGWIDIPDEERQEQTSSNAIIASGQGKY
jgi:hypothetical protein